MNRPYPPAPTDVRINLLQNPTCLRCGDLWVSHRSSVSENACRVILCEGRTAAESGCRIYDTGRLPSDGGPVVIPADICAGLTPGRLYYVAVSVWDDAGRESAMSEPIPFTVETPWEDTNGIWASPVVDGSAPDFAFLRRVFTLTEDELSLIDRAFLSVTAASPEPARQFVYQMSVNGRDMGVGPCRLGKSPDGCVILPYATYEVTDALRVGENVLAAVCYTLAEHAFLCRLTGYDREGKPCLYLHSGRDYALWQALDGDAVFGKDNSIGTHYFKAHACNIHAPLYPFGFSDAGYTADGRWATPVLTGDIRAGRLLLPDETEPVRRYSAETPVAVTICNDGATLIDLGAEIVGGLRLTLQNPTDVSVSVTLDYAEQLISDGTGGMTVKSPMNTGNCYRETWTLKPGMQTLETLSLMTFRYVRILGLPAPIAAADAVGRELRKPFCRTDSAVVTDHALLKDILTLTKHTICVTSQDIYVDSQSRERGAYEGDLYINMLTAYATEASYAPARLTTAYLLGHRTWPADYLLCIIFAAHADYMATGDRRLLSAWYETLKANLFSDCIDARGLIQMPVVASSNQNSILVDWPPSERDGYDMTVAYNTVLNALQVRALGDMAAIATALGKHSDAADFAAQREALKAVMLDKLYDPACGLFRDGLSAEGVPSPHHAQHATAYALAAGIYADTAMAHRMAEAMTADGKLHVSVYAAFFLLDGLYRAGRGDIANRLMLDEDCTEGARTWAYMIRRLGATVTTEAWNEKNKPNMTLSHPWGAAPGYFFMAGICGITPISPGYATMNIRPAFWGIESADVTLPTIRGPIRMAWQSIEGGHRLTVVLPANTRATLHLPDDRTVTIHGGEAFETNILISC